MGFSEGAARRTNHNSSSISWELCSHWGFVPIEIENPWRKAQSQSCLGSDIWSCRVVPWGPAVAGRKGREEMRDFCCVSGNPEAQIFPGPPELLEPNGLMKSHYILNYIWILVGDFSPSCNVNWERLFSWGAWKSSLHLINEKNKLIFLDFGRRHHPPGLRITHGEAKTVV